MFIKSQLLEAQGNISNQTQLFLKDDLEAIKTGNTLIIYATFLLSMK